MAHNHSHVHNSHEHNSKGKMSNIRLAFLLNISFAIIEFIGGLYTGSTAILSDAIHDLSDSIALLLSMIFEKISTKPSNDKYTFGYKRISIIGAIINLLILFVGTIFVFIRAITVLYNQQAIKVEGMIILAILGIVVNGISVLKISGSSKILDKTVRLHLLEDLFGWISVFIVSIVMMFTKWYILDTLLSLALCIFIFYNVSLQAVEVFKIIMEANMDTDLYNEVKSKILNIDKVEELVELKMWTLDGQDTVVTLKVRGQQDSLQNIKKVLNEVDIKNSTVEIL